LQAELDEKVSILRDREQQLIEELDAKRAIRQGTEVAAKL